MIFNADICRQGKKSVQRTKSQNDIFVNASCATITIAACQIKLRIWPMEKIKKKS